LPLSDKLYKELIMKAKIRIINITNTESENEKIKQFLEKNSSFQLITQFFSGKEAFSQCANFSPDIILIDRDIEDIDSIELLRQITLACPSAKFIMVSYVNEPEWIREALLSGAKCFLTKPITQAELQHQIIYAYTRT